MQGSTEAQQRVERKLQRDIDTKERLARLAKFTEDAVRHNAVDTAAVPPVLAAVPVPIPTVATAVAVAVERSVVHRVFTSVVAPVATVVGFVYRNIYWTFMILVGILMRDRVPDLGSTLNTVTSYTDPMTIVKIGTNGRLARSTWNWFSPTPITPPREEKRSTPKCSSTGVETDDFGDAWRKTSVEPYRRIRKP
jgi:hypothetical protein